MKSIQSIFIVACVSLVILSGCSDPIAPEETGEVNVSSQLTTGTVSSTFSKDANVTAGPTCDSVVVSRIRFVFSDLKMHRDGSDSNDSKGMIKAGPFIMEYTPGAVKLVTTSLVPVGTYNRIKYEIHKLDDSKDTAAINNPAYADFITGGRYTYIIEGAIWNSNNATLFLFKSSKNENLNLAFNAPVVVTKETPAAVTLDFDPSTIFKQGAKPLDPRYAENQGDIEKMVKDAFHALKK